MELKINKLVITRETYKNRISEIITKIDNYLEGKTNSTKENLTIQKNNYKYKLNRLKQELNELHEQYANGKKEEENMGNKKQMQIDLATVRQKFIMLKKQYSVLKDYSFNLTQYIAEQNETKRDIKQECVDIKEKIQRAKLYINKTKEEGELLQKNEESELYDKRIEELDSCIPYMEYASPDSHDYFWYNIETEDELKMLNEAYYFVSDCDAKLPAIICVETEALGYTD